MIQIGVVGLASFYGPAYANRIARRVDAEVGGVVARVSDADLKRLGRPTRMEFGSEYECDCYDDVATLAADVDAVVVASRTTRRAADAVVALEAGRPVLTAKPVAGVADEAREVARAATAETPAVTTCPARFDDAIGELAGRTREDAIGEVVSVRGAIRHDRVPEAGIDVNAEHAPGEAGATYAMGYYTADMLLWLTESDPLRVSGTVENTNTPHSDHPDLGAATVEFADATQGTMTLTYCTDCRERLGNWELEVVGTDGILRTAHNGYEGIHWHGGDERRPEAFGRSGSSVLDRQLDAFLRTVETGTYGRLVPDPTTVADAIQLCEAWETAAETGQPASFSG